MVTIHWRETIRLLITVITHDCWKIHFFKNLDFNMSHLHYMIFKYHRFTKNELDDWKWYPKWSISRYLSYYHLDFTESIKPSAEVLQPFFSLWEMYGFILKGCICNNATNFQQFLDKAVEKNYFYKYILRYSNYRIIFFTFRYTLFEIKQFSHLQFLLIHFVRN